jgi:hypothetical protein
VTLRCERGRGTKKTKAIRCGVCYYSIVLNAHRFTSIADTDIDAVRKQKKTEYDKQYRLKPKLLLQASTSTETELAEKQKKAEYVKQHRLKRKLLLQQQASKDIYMIRYFRP